MSGSIQMLRQDSDLSDEQAALIDIVLRESDRLNQTIRGFLSRHARPQRIATARVDVRQVITDTARLLQNSSELTDAFHEIAVNIPESDVPYHADEGQIRQVVWNLATNGLRAMLNGGQLRLSVQQVLGRGRCGRRGRDWWWRIRASGSRRKSSTASSAVPRRVHLAHRPRAVDRAPHRLATTAAMVKVTSQTGPWHDRDGQAADQRRARDCRALVPTQVMATWNFSANEPGNRSGLSRVLVVDDERSMREVLTIVLKRTVMTCSSRKTAP